MWWGGKTACHRSRMSSLPSPPATAGASEELANWFWSRTIWVLRAGPKHAHRYQYSPLTEVYNVAHEAADTCALETRCQDFDRRQTTELTFTWGGGTESAHQTRSAERPTSRPDHRRQPSLGAN